MKKETFTLLENFMLSWMQDAAHDKDHVYRVLYTALEIAENEAVDKDVLIAACLLHDIARRDQLENPAICHAEKGAERAEKFLLETGFAPAFAAHVRNCIYTHRFRKSHPPETMEAKILFDADKLDAAGAIGLARTLVYKGTSGDPLYTLLDDGRVCDGSGDAPPSFFQEYRFKLEKIYDRFYTEKARQMAEQRRKAAADFYHSLYQEVSRAYQQGQERLTEMISE